MLTRRFSGPLGLAIALLLATTGGIVLAQADSGVAENSPIDASGSYEVGGVQVDVTGKDANAARYAGWRLAQRNFEEGLTAVPPTEEAGRKELLYQLASGAAENGDLPRAIDLGHELANLYYAFKDIGKRIEEWTDRLQNA